MYIKIKALRHILSLIDAVEFSEYSPPTFKVVADYSDLIGSNQTAL